MPFPRTLSVAVIAALTATAASLTVAGAGASSRSAALRAPLAGHQTLAAQMRGAAHVRLLAEHARLHRRLARIRGEGVDRAALRSGHGWSNARLRGHNRRLRRAVELARRRAAAGSAFPGGPTVPVPPVLAAIAACESGGNPAAIGGGGAYRGKYQMDMATWASVGGRGDPAAAPEAEQDLRAALLLARAGTSPWPNCG